MHLMDEIFGGSLSSESISKTKSLSQEARPWSFPLKNVTSSKTCKGHVALALDTSVAIGG
ncbi:hypothetical protein C2845_PM10G02680 [Panicum miliaceum]|uniref:Uncharacterized protein n=1 Tax=Panicum miliaceum TaxID=4540 RepID=A0A3L6PCC0_PANMI|nr:hypothetical protein C2845_PM10G02680 [Panicum miliaceum]